MADVNMVKCACADCVCVIDAGAAVEKNGRLFCGSACADGHTDKSGCGHVGCGCHG